MVAPDKKKPNNIELLPAETPPPRDLSQHSIRDDAVVERTVQSKKAAPNSTIPPPAAAPVPPPQTTVRRNRKAAPPKPGWATALSVLTKNFVALLVLAGVAQSVRYALRSWEEGGSPPPSAAFSDFEGRIAEVEKLLKSTTKMMQVQVEVVDRKIDSEISGLRVEVEEKGTHLKELEARTESLERSLGELRDVNWLSKDEFDKIFEELKKKVTNFGESGDGEASLNDIRAYARDLVLKEIEKHAADGLGRVDYALASGGAMVVKHSEPYMAGKGSNWFLTSARKGVHNDADKVLKPSFGEPGQCFALKGSSGFVQIRLRTAIIPDAVTLEHVAKVMSFSFTYICLFFFAVVCAFNILLLDL